MRDWASRVVRPNIRDYGLGDTFLVPLSVFQVSRPEADSIAVTKGRKTNFCETLGPVEVLSTLNHVG